MNDDKTVAAPVGLEFMSEGVGFSVGVACDENRGQWFCVTHDETFVSQLMKDFHIGDGEEHVLTWVCLFHGPEVP